MRLFLTLLTGAALAWGQAPSINANGIVHGATLSRAGLAPGVILTVFGENLAAAPMSANDTPWPTSLGGVSVLFDGRPGAIFYVSPSQINVQAPWSVLELGQATKMVAITVQRDSRTSPAMNVMFMATSPGLFTLNGTGAGMALAMNSDGSYANPPGAIPGAMSRPARVGSVVSLYATGLGPVTPSVAAGQVSRDLFRRTNSAAEVTIGGRSAEVLYSGLAANVPGLYQLNVVVPAGITAGMNVPVQVRIGNNMSAERVTISVDGAVEPAQALPRADASTIWDYVFRNNFRQNFSLIPGKNQLYQGIAPHAQLLTAYLNPVAREAIEKRAGVLPAGSMVMKEAHGPGGQHTLSYIMYKIAGFDPANGDWYYSTRRPDGSLGTSGAVAGCINCHARSRANDYLFLATPAPAPAPNAAAVREYIARQNYRQTWRLWPGTAENQASAAPHGASVSIWMNEIAFDAVNNGSGRMPAGATVIKENYTPARELAALTVMMKSPGFDPANNDWYYLQQLPNGTAAAEGKVEGCISCHEKERGNDFLYTSRLSRPAPRAADVWSAVTSADYQKKWKLFPGTTAQMPGQSPHGAFISTYVNDIALEGVNGKRPALAPGSIVLKENYTPEKTLAAVTLMYKVPGFDPDNGDWYWLQRTADGAVRAEGRVTGCIGCHSAKASNDYLYLGTLR